MREVMREAGKHTESALMEPRPPLWQAAPVQARAAPQRVDLHSVLQSAQQMLEN
jgi:hypothetical protein